MTRPTAYEMFALLFLYIVMQLFAAWSVTIIVSAAPSLVVSTGPKALFTEVGMVYPECDFAHVLIQLPIRELLNRTDYVYSVFEARMRKNISSSEGNFSYKICWVVKLHVSFTCATQYW